MKKLRFLLCCAAVFVLLLGCAPKKGDYFAPFQDEFSARIAGEWQSMEFEAQLTASAREENGAREMTVTFYAPATLSGTVLKRDAAGNLFLSSGALSLPLGEGAAAGYAALLDLFPVTGEICTVTRENGNTRLIGAGFSLLFAPNGTPLAAENAAARVEVKEFARRASEGF